MKFKTIMLSVFLSAPAWADIVGDVRFCFDRYSSDVKRASECASEELARAVRSLQDRNGGGPSDTLSLEYQCGVDGAHDTYSIIVSGKSATENREKAQAQCKWSNFKVVKEWVETSGSKTLTCQCGVDNASDTYSVNGFGLNFGEAYADAKASCRWTPILKNCVRAVAATASPQKNILKAKK